ncbi:hypothetical protein BVG79_00404 [Ketogulonicigenium robustum]|uniref:Zinc finger/thioredoxin putative domain-containing protein n=1 Tax=Ketogulonicigenium robustum TaxID=92947 RepID=A0A1W6NWX2_9RHOB|nr:zinc-ribbon domain-containing protein [Ketogulonicigenium robustum]ARO13758.1 hypothetical protein BVG79_00404 [Ketogulonicigenium robustum]
MRLVCPNCGATYQVSGDLIPDSGRDVECSACGQSWFVIYPHAAGPSVESAPNAASHIVPPAHLGPKSTVSPAVAEILRAEAAFEAKARIDERSAGDTPPEDVADAPPASDSDLDYAAPDVAPAVNADHAPKYRSDSTPLPPPLFRPASAAEAEAARAAAAAARAAAATPSAALVPHVAPPQPPEASGAGGGFLAGLLFAGAIALTLVLLYHGAPAIVQGWPSAADYLQPYVAWVDGARLWVQDQAAAIFPR